ncbi:MAG: hypothetical protein A3F11_06030 [Gammaproteobacteria bacterium RIFCSPHIGHO2_12_FULL_37_14]|nr:MAG: hypothetical protein A3F11_06030 [Gammaproteobacteria bacterium RIFCSPHIGHO2_12_FULL_37_14]
MQASAYSAIFFSPMGPIGIILRAKQLARLTFLEPSHSHVIQHPDDDSNNSSSLIQQITNELQHYFEHAKHIFTISLHIEGTPFQQRVWQALQKIPSGNTLTYGTLAKKLQTSPRAIGQACRTNRLPLIIPCHRIIATHHLGGYVGNISGPFAKIKEQLLKHEQS